jgi:23S rRNA (pseudouridine1915-N3)-methyltransferase
VDNEESIFQKRAFPLVFGEQITNRLLSIRNRRVILLAMLVSLAHIGPAPKPSDPLSAAAQTYLDRCAAYGPCRPESFRSEDALMEWIGRQKARTSPFIVLLDSKGRSMTSTAFATWLGARRDEGAQHIVFAIGPADGWSPPARTRAGLLLSLGPMTMAHALARVAMAEQLYRAFTILAGHPYHTGH